MPERVTEIRERRPRYVVQELTGWEILAEGKRGKLRHTFYICDLGDRARIVYELECAHRGEGGKRSEDGRRKLGETADCTETKRRANRVCRNLNANYDHSVNAPA